MITDIQGCTAVLESDGEQTEQYSGSISRLDFYDVILCDTLFRKSKLIFFTFESPDLQHKPVFHSRVV